MKYNALHRSFDVSNLARVFQGYLLGAIEAIVEEVVTRKGIKSQM
jgi:hypothetical protein